MLKNKISPDKKSFWEQVVNWGILAIFAITPLLYSNGRIASAVTSKQYFFMGVIDLLVIAWVWLMVQDHRYRLDKKNWLTLIPVGVVFLSMAISTLLGADSYTSLYSTIERGGGFIFMLHAGVFIIMIASVIRVAGMSFFRKIVQAILVSAIGVAIMTFFTKESFSIGMRWLDESAGGAMLGNSTIAGAYFICALFLGLIVWFQEESKRKKWFYGIGMGIILFSPILFNVKGLFDGVILKNIIAHPFIVIGQARAAVVSLGLGLIISGLVYVIITTQKKIIKWVSGLLIAIIIGGLIFAGFQIFQDGSKTQDAFINQVGPNRILFWKEAFQGIKERPIIGWGPENYKIVHQKYFNPLLAGATHGSEMWVDKPHNTFIEITVGQGFIGLITHVILIVWLFFALWKPTRKGVIDPKTGAILCGLLFAYILQNQFAFDSIVSIMVFSGIIGVVAGWASLNADKKNYYDNREYSYVVWGITAIMIVVWIFVAVIPSRKMVAAKGIFDASVPVRIEKYQKLFSGTGSAALNTDLGMIFYTLAESYLAQRSEIENNPDFIKQAVPELEALIAAGEKNKKYAQYDYKFMLAMSIFQEVKIGLSQKFSQEELNRMQQYITETIRLAPTNPFGYLVQSKVFLYTEEIDLARNAIDQAIVLNPIITESHDQKNSFEKVFGTKQQQKDALENAQKNIPGYQFK